MEHVLCMHEAWKRKIISRLNRPQAPGLNCLRLAYASLDLFLQGFFCFKNKQYRHMVQSLKGTNGNRVRVAPSLHGSPPLTISLKQKLSRQFGFKNIYYLMQVWNMFHLFISNICCCL